MSAQGGTRCFSGAWVLPGSGLGCRQHIPRAPALFPCTHAVNSCPFEMKSFLCRELVPLWHVGAKGGIVHEINALELVPAETLTKTSSPSRTLSLVSFPLCHRTRPVFRCKDPC